MFVKRIAICCFTAVILCGALNLSTQAQPAKLKDPLLTHAFDLMARKFGEAEFDPKKTQKFGIEAYKDNNNNVGVYISQIGSLACVNTGFQTLTKEISPARSPDWVAGLDLKARKAGQTEWKDAAVFSLEIFLDTNTGNWIYITEKGNLAATAVKAPKSAERKAQVFSHSVDLEVRKGGDKDWKNAKKFGIEVYLDPNTGNLVYISETGAIAVIAENPATHVKGEGKDPQRLHGLDLKIRKHDESTFNKDTKTIGVEVYRDGNNGNLIFLAENGNLAVTPGPSTAPAPGGEVKDPKWTHGVNFSCRKTGEKEFSATTQVFGVEVFRDENVGVVLYLSETGSLSGVKLQ